MYLPLVDLQRKIFFIYVLVHSGEMSIIFFLLHTGDLILYMAYVFSRENNYLFSFRVFSNRISYSNL